MKIRIAILDMNNNAPNEGMRCIKMLVEEFIEELNGDAYYQVFNVRGANEVPQLIDFDIFISSGGPGNPLPSGSAWETDYLHLIDSLFYYNKTSTSHKKFLFLICHSFQLVSHYLNIGTVMPRKSTSFGVFPIHKTEDGKQEALFELLPNDFYAVDSRDYQLVQPKWDMIGKLGANVLCLEKIRPHVPLERAMMAMRFSPEIVGMQFHPEADALGMLHYFDQEDKKKQIIKNHGLAKYEDMVTHLNDPDKILLTESVILPTFLRNAAEVIK
jgi:homoserine O-succinyltransferase/O-acetyltransferase